MSEQCRDTVVPLHAIGCSGRMFPVRAFASQKSGRSSQRRGVRNACGHAYGERMGIATADLYDERGDELDSVGIQFHDIGGHVAFDGPVRTIRCHRDNAT